MCSNQFLEDDGYCTVCGSNHFRKQTRAQQETAARKQQHARELLVERAARIQLAIETSSVYSTARNTANKVIADFGLDARVIFHNRERSSCANLDRGVITFGYQMLDYAAQRGMTEYKSCAWVLGYKQLFGLQAVKAIALHEAAHILAYALYGDEGADHGHNFQQTYKQLVDAYLQQGA